MYFLLLILLGGLLVCLFMGGVVSFAVLLLFCSCLIDCFCLLVCLSVFWLQLPCQSLGAIRPVNVLEHFQGLLHPRLDISLPHYSICTANVTSEWTNFHCNVLSGLLHNNIHAAGWTVWANGFNGVRGHKRAETMQWILWLRWNT